MPAWTIKQSRFEIGVCPVIGRKVVRNAVACVQDSEREGGFVLIAVLAALTLLAMVALLLTRTVSLETKITAYNARQAREEALADGLARLAMLHLVINPPTAAKSGLFRVDGIPVMCRVGDHVASISFLDSDGQINLNLASADLLQRLLEGVGAGDNAAKLAQAIVEFRSAGGASTAGGDKSADYQLAGLAHGPKNGPFASVRELDQVLGMTPALLTDVSPLVTVHSRFATINPSVASYGVLAALSGEGKVDASEGTPKTLDALRASLSLPAAYTYIAKTRSVTSFTSSAYVARVAVGDGRTTRFVRQATVMLVGATTTGTSLKEWTAPDPWLYPTRVAADAELPPCLGGALWLEP